MTATIYFQLSAAGQKDAILRGLPAQKIQSISGEIEERDLVLMSILPTGEMRTASTQINVHEAKQCGLDIPDVITRGPAPYFKLDTYSSVREILDRMHSAIATEKEERKAENQRNIEQAKQRLDKAFAHAQSDEKDELSDLQYISVPISSPQELHDHPAWQLRRDRIAAKKSRHEADKAAKEAAKEAYIGQWIATRGTDSQRSRHADGLLCRDEIISAIAAGVLEPFGEPMKWKTCKDYDHKCSYTTLDCLDADSYARWAVLKSGLPEGATWEFSEITPCLRDPNPSAYDEMGEDDDLGETVIAVTLMIPEGPFKFERTVAL